MDGQHWRDNTFKRFFLTFLIKFKFISSLGWVTKWVAFRMIHVWCTNFVFSIIVIVNFLIVLIIFFLEQSLVSLGTICSAWRCSHIVCILLLFALSGFNCNLGVLIKAPDWQYNDFVVQKCSEHENKEAWDGLPLEWFESKWYTTNPDEHCPWSVNCGPLSSRC